MERQGTKSLWCVILGALSALVLSEDLPISRTFTTLNNGAKPKLMLDRSTGDFRILQFTDQHYGEGENVWWGPVQDSNNTRVMNAVLSHEKSELVVFSGDCITGNNVRNNATNYWQMMLDPVISQQRRWAVLFGNHDDMPFQPSNGVQSTTTREQLMEYDRHFPLSYSSSGPTNISGVSNYVLEVYKDDQALDPIFLIYMFDSGGGTLEEAIQTDQVEWYKSVSASYEQRFGLLPAVAYMHIPLVQYDTNYDKDKCFGMYNGFPEVQDKDTGLYDAFQQQGDVRAVFVGHIHQSSYCCPSEKLWLCFGRHSGYGGYGDWARGARVLKIHFDVDGKAFLSTYVRLENGTIVDAGDL